MLMNSRIVSLSLVFSLILVLGVLIIPNRIVTTTMTGDDTPDTLNLVSDGQNGDFLMLMRGTDTITVLADGPDAINIYNNSDFATYANSGDGSITTPYIISDRNIVSYSGYAIYIEDTTAHCVFSNITVGGDSSGYAVYMENVSNVNVTDSVFANQRSCMLVDNCSNIGIMNVSITHYGGDYGVRIEQSDIVLVEFCHFEGMQSGIQLWSSFRVAIRDNEFIGTGLTFYGTSHVSAGIVVEGNTVNGRPIGYLYNGHDITIDISSYGQVILVNCVNVTLNNGNIYDTNYGVQFIFCQNSIIAFSNITNNGYGIVVYESFYCRIYANNITDNHAGAMGYFAVGTIVHENNFINNYFGLWIYYGCSSSAIYLNNFIGNVQNSRDDGGREDTNLNWIVAKFTNSISGWPLDNVTMTVEKAGKTYLAHSNEDGFIRVFVPVLGEYSVTIEKHRYQTISTNFAACTEDLQLFGVDMDKANLGPGTGYVQVRLMEGTTPVEGAVVSVYSVLDGAYYYHGDYSSVTTGWVTITGLYYDSYEFIITHPEYETKTIHQAVISDGLAGTYSNIQLEKIVTDALVYGGVYDFANLTSLEGVNVTVYNPFETQTCFTDAEGAFAFLHLPLGLYSMEISMDGYDTEVLSLNITEVGDYSGNPVIVYLTYSDFVPEGAMQSVVNSWDNEKSGNYWDDLGGEVVLASSGPYFIPGNNFDNPVDEYPLDEVFAGGIGIVLPTRPTITEPTTGTTTEPTTGTTTENGFDPIIVSFTIMGCAIIVVIALVLLRRKMR